ncbi:hypothetical protein [Hymenobacter swuensis]|uniref:hypothetical protein n=1 Tax=Hymenobacter swuensis TaxID=1446467 RepID=UPI0005C77C26|nr:hypothetical protein [Hymenobacter swuensis]
MKKTFIKLLLPALIIVVMFGADYNARQVKGILQNGTAVRAKVVNVDFIKNSWRLQMLYEYKSQLYNRESNTSREHSIGDSVTIRFEKDKPNGRIVVDDKACVEYAW